MVIISKTILVEFGVKHADSIEPLNWWYEIAKMANWSSFSDIKKSFNSVDYIGNDRYVFKLRGTNIDSLP